MYNNTSVDVFLQTPFQSITLKPFFYRRLFLSTFSPSFRYLPEYIQMSHEGPKMYENADFQQCKCYYHCHKLLHWTKITFGDEEGKYGRPRRYIYPQLKIQISS
jgi:hypothetical protein